MLSATAAGATDFEPALLNPSLSPGLYIGGRGNNLKPRPKLEPIRDPRDPSKGEVQRKDYDKAYEVDLGRYVLDDSSQNNKPPSPPHNYTDAQARYAELMGPDLFAPLPTPPSPHREPSWNQRTAQPFVVPDGFNGLSDVRPMHWGKAKSGGAMLLRQAESTLDNPWGPRERHPGGTTWGPYDPAPMHPADPSAMIPRLPDSSVRPVIGYEKQSSYQRDSRLYESLAHTQEELRAVREVMHCLWSDQPAGTLVKNLESLSNVQRHSVLETMVGLLRNTGLIAHSLSDMSASLDVFTTGQTVLEGAMAIVGCSAVVLHVCAYDPRGEDLLWRLQHGGGDLADKDKRVDPRAPKPKRVVVRAPHHFAGIVGACLEMQEPLIVWDTNHDARYDSHIDNVNDAVGEGAAMACIPLVDARWHGGGPQPHALGVLQMVVAHGPDKGRKRRLGLEMRSLLAMVGKHAGQCITNAMLHMLQAELGERLDANQSIMRLLSREMTVRIQWKHGSLAREVTLPLVGVAGSGWQDEHIAATIATEVAIAYNGTRAAVFLVQDFPGTQKTMTRVEVSMHNNAKNVHVMEGIPFSEGLAGQAYTNARTMNMADVDAEGSQLSRIDLPSDVQPSDEKVFHLLTVPVITNASTKPTPQNSALAIIQIARSGIKQHFTNVEVQALEELATLLAPLLDTLQMEKLTRMMLNTAATQQAKANVFMQDIGFTPLIVDLERALAEQMAKVCEYVRANKGDVFVIDSHTNELVSNFQTTHGGTVSLREDPIRLPLTHGLLAETARSGEVLRIRDASIHPTYAQEVDGDVLGIFAMGYLAVPVWKSQNTPERISDVDPEAMTGERMLAPSAGPTASTMAANGVLGVIVVVDKLDGSEFSEHEQEILKELASVGTSNVETLVVYENFQYQTIGDNNRNACLIEATSAMLAAVPKGVSEVLKVAVSLGVNLFQCEVCDIYLYDDKADVLFRDPPAGVRPQAFDCIKPGEGSIGHVLRSGETLRESSGEEELTSVMTAPLIDENADLVGVVQLRNRSGHIPGEPIVPFSEPDELLLPGYTLQVATVLSHVLQIVKLQERAALDAELRSTIAPMTEKLRLGELCETVASYAKLLLSAEECTLFFADEQQGEMVSYYDRVFDAELRMPITSLAGQTYTSGGVLNIPDVDQDERYEVDANERMKKFRSTLCVPVRLNSDGRTLGVLQVINKIPREGGYLLPHEVSAFTNLEEDLATALSRLVASHIQNATLMQRKDFAFAYSKQVMHSKHSLVLVLNQEGYVTMSTGPLETLSTMSEDDIQTHPFKDWLDAGGNVELSKNIQQVYDTNTPLSVVDGRIYTTAGPVPMAYTINPLTKPSQGGTFYRKLPPAPEPELLFPGVLIKHKGGVVVFIQVLSDSLRCKRAFEHTLSSESAELALAKNMLKAPQAAPVVTIQCSIQNGQALLNEKTSPQDMLLLNKFFDCAVPCITTRGGAVGKYTSEGFTGYFGLLKKGDKGQFERLAMEAALSVLRGVEKMNRDRLKTCNQMNQNFTAAVVGVVVTSEKLVIGKMGCHAHLEFGVIGDGVSQAMHVSTMSKQYLPNDDSIIITGPVFELIKEECVFRELDSLMMPRSTEKSQGVKIYRYVGQHQDSILDLTNQALDVYADALHLYQEGEWGKAMPFFRKAYLGSQHEGLPHGDTAAEMMVQRCKSLLEAPPSDWKKAYVAKWG